MNTATHVMAGVFVAQALMVARDRHPKRWVGVGCGVVAFAVGAVLHLALDALPHNNWICNLEWFPHVPYDWVLYQAIWALPVVVLGLYAGRDHPVLFWVGVVGAMYPDFEKLGYVDFQLPEWLVMFPTHSLKLSSNHFDWPLWQTMLLEGSILVPLLVGTVLLARYRAARPVSVSGWPPWPASRAAGRTVSHPPEKAAPPR